MNRINPIRKLATLAASLTVTLLTATSAWSTGSTSLDIEELYGAGGNTGAILNADYAVLFNRSTGSVSINGWSLQYASATGASWSVATLPNAVIPAGGYYLVAFAGGSIGTGFVADYTNTAINMAAAGGKLALVNSTVALTTSNAFGASGVVDLVGGSTANVGGFEGASRAPAMSTTLIDRRQGAGCTDTDNNGSDFTAVTIVANYQPPSSATAIAPCDGSAATPLISSISPSSQMVNAGTTVQYDVLISQGSAPLTYLWYKELVGVSTTLVAGATSPILTLANVTGGDAANYQVVVSNSVAPTATSAVVSLTVVDPYITGQPPTSAFGLLDGTMQISVVGAGTSIVYQWYFTDSGGNIIAPVANGTQPSGSWVTNAGTSTLTFTNLQYADATNLLAVVSNSFGAVTSTVVSLSVSTSAILAFWNFNQLSFPSNLVNPAPWFGNGTAVATNVVASAGSVDPSDGPGFGLGVTNYSWGTATYPATGLSNKLCGVQFKVSTVGAKNIGLSYDSRVSATASDYERVQFTTNGTSWIDYPSSSTFAGIATTYLSPPFTNSFVGFSNVANNPNFGIRIVTEVPSTATYGVSTNTNYLGTVNTYGASGTVTYDRVTITGVAITNNNTPPTISGIADTSTVDTTPININYTVGDLETPANDLTVTAVSLNPTTVSPSFTYGGSGPNRTLGITPNAIPDVKDAGPILVTVTDGNGDSTVTWFTLTLTTANLPPTNSLVSQGGTNTLVNTPVTIPFKVGDDHTAVSGLTYSAVSLNNTLVPTGTNIVFGNTGTANPTVTIYPAYNQLGVAAIQVTVNDNDTFVNEPKTTTATFYVMVRPNTNVVMIDYFDYDNSGALDTVTTSGGFWGHLSGPYGQMQVNAAPTGGVAVVDTFDYTESLNAPLLGGTNSFKTNSAAVLYASFIIKMDPANMPINNGTYFALFNDGTGTTGNYQGRIMVATNGAASGHYRIGVNNYGADATSAQMLAQDLSPYSNYVVVASLVLSNGFTSLWVDPVSQSSANVTDTTTNATQYNIGAFELREAGGSGGSVSVGHIKVGTTFDSVCPSLQIQSSLPNVVLNWSDRTLGIQSATNVTGPWTDVIGAEPLYTNNTTTNDLFFRFGQ